MGDWITMESITRDFCLDELECSLVVCEIVKGHVQVLKWHTICSESCTIFICQAA